MLHIVVGGIVGFLASAIVYFASEESEKDKIRANKRTLWGFFDFVCLS